jgi:hypothetical protein
VFHITAVISDITARILVIPTLVFQTIGGMSVMVAPICDTTGAILDIVGLLWHVSAFLWQTSGELWQTKNELCIVIEMLSDPDLECKARRLRAPWS